MEIKIYRLNEIWIKEEYNINSMEDIEKCINYDIDPLYSEQILDSCEYTGYYEIVDEDGNIITSNL